MCHFLFPSKMTVCIALAATGNTLMVLGIEITGGENYLEESLSAHNDVAKGRGIKPPRLLATSLCVGGANETPVAQET